MRRGDERGLALLSALLTVALLTVIALELTDATLVNAHLSRNAGNAMAAQLLARSAEVAAEALILDDRDRSGNVTSPDGQWAFPVLAYPTENGSLGFRVTDEEGKLDLNGVRNARQKEVLASLFSSLGLDPSLLDGVEAWVSPADQPVAGRDARDYCQLDMACEPRHEKLRDLEELRLIRGFDERAIRLLRPHVTVYGKGTNTQVNVNTATPLVLQAIGCEVGADFRPPPDGFQSTDKVEECKSVARQLKVRSDTFSIEATGTVGDVTQGIQAVVRREGSNRAVRLAWHERPVSDLDAGEVP